MCKVFYVYKALSWAFCHRLFQNVIHLQIQHGWRSLLGTLPFLWYQNITELHLLHFVYKSMNLSADVADHWMKGYWIDKWIFFHSNTITATQITITNYIKYSSNHFYSVSFICSLIFIRLMLHLLIPFWLIIMWDCTALKMHLTQEMYVICTWDWQQNLTYVWYVAPSTQKSTLTCCYASPTICWLKGKRGLTSIYK